MKLKIKFILIALITIFNFYSKSSHACEDFSFNLSNITFTLAENSGAYRADLNVSRRSQEGECPFYIRIINAENPLNVYGSARSPQGEIKYSISRDPSPHTQSVLNSSADWGNKKQFIEGTIGKTSINFPLYFHVLTEGMNQEVIPHGFYQDTFLVQVYDGKRSETPKTPFLVRKVSVKIFVPSAIRISLVSAGSPFQPHDTNELLDFDMLQKGKFKEMDLWVKSNTGYSVYLSSENDGSLKMSKNLRSEKINYDFFVDSIRKPLTGSAHHWVLVAKRSQGTPPGGRSHRFRFQIGDVVNKLAGEYSDFITVTVVCSE